MKSIYDYAVEYCGDPSSHQGRGAFLLNTLAGLGLRKTHRVLNIGCGALSEGAPLIRYLEPGNFTGVDPNGWLIRAALDHDPSLEAKRPSWSFVSDFDAPGGPYDYVISHSVLSHVAHWQLELALSNVRKAVDEGAIWLASIRLDQYDHFAKEWVYPGNSFFRKATVQALAYYFGWHAEFMPDIREEMRESFPNDVHDWIAFHAIPSSSELNDRRLEIERQRREQAELEAAVNVEKNRLEMIRVEELEGDLAAASEAPDEDDSPGEEDE